MQPVKTAEMWWRHPWFPREMTSEIPYWWRVTTQIWVVLLIGWSKFYVYARCIIHPLYFAFALQSYVTAEIHLKVGEVVKQNNRILLRFSQTCEFWSSKPNWRLRFSLPSIILTDLLGNKTFTLKGSKGHGFWFVIGMFLFFKVRCCWS